MNKLHTISPALFLLLLLLGFELPAQTSVTGSDETRSNVITLVTNLSVGDELVLAYRSLQDQPITIEGASGEARSNSESRLTLKSQTIKLIGEIIKIDVAAGEPELPGMPSPDPKRIKSIAVSSSPNLKAIVANGNEIDAVDLSGASAMIELDLRQNRLSAIDLSACKSLNALYLGGNQISSLDLSHNKSLVNVLVPENKISELDLSALKWLQVIDVDRNEMTSLRLGDHPELVTLYCGFNKLQELNLSQAPKLAEVYCYFNDLSSLDISNKPDLRTLMCQTNKLRGKAMQQIIETLPTLTEDETTRSLFVPVMDADHEETNICTSYQVSLLKKKNWQVAAAGNYGMLSDFSGSEGYYNVSLKSNTDLGSLSLAEGVDPYAVAKDTKISIVATPLQDGITLTTLTANGVDILTDRSIVVTEDLVINGTFERGESMDRVNELAKEISLRQDRGILLLSGAEAHALVRLYSISGRLLQERATDADGCVQISVEGFVDDVLLIQVNQRVYKVLVV